MVELRNVSVTYSNGVDALNDVSLKINDGDFVFVVGHSGAGKSTLIRLLLKEIEPTKGRIHVNGYDVRRMRKSQTYKLRRTIGFVFQDFKLIDTMNVYDNIAFVLRCMDCKEKYIRSRVDYVVNLVALKDKLYCKPNELSGGEQQRVAIARALVNDPKIIIADEPTGNLDPTRSREIIELLKAINECGTTIMMVTHEHGLVKNYGGRIVTLQDGRLVFDDVLAGKSEQENNDNV